MEAVRIGISQPKMLDMMHGEWSNFSERKFIDCLVCLGYNIEINIGPAKADVEEGRSA